MCSPLRRTTTPFTITSRTPTVLVRLLEGGAIGDGGGVEDDHVGEHAGPEETALLELEVGCGKAAHPVDRLGEGQDLVLPHGLPRTRAKLP